MRSFPFDSEVTYDELGNPSFDRGVDSSILADFLHLMFGDGVFPNPSTGLQVTTSENDMSVVVLPGNCMIQGRMGIEEYERELVFEASGTSYDRIDSVVARLNTNYDYRDIDLYVVKGTEASVPTAPDLTRTGGIYEIRLANVFIAKNTTVITAERITDTRLTSECGIVTSNPNPVDTNTIFNQYQAALNEYLVYVQECIDGTTVSNLQKQIDEVTENSAENLIPYPYYDIASCASVTKNGLTITDNGDGTVTIGAGTATANTYFFLISTVYADAMILDEGVYTASGVPDGYSTICIGVTRNVNGTRHSAGKAYGGSITTFNVTNDGNTRYDIHIGVTSGTVISEPITIKPMLVKGSHKCDYAPYRLSKAKLREDVDALNSSLTKYIETTAPFAYCNHDSNANATLKNGEVKMRGVIYSSSNALKSGETVGTLLNAYKPKSKVYSHGFIGQRYGQWYPCQFNINTDGTIVFYTQGLDISAFGELVFDVNYYVN